MFYLVLGYPEPFWGAQGLYKVLVGSVYYARGRFPQEKKSICTIPAAPRSQFLGVRTACVTSMRDIGDESYTVVLGAQKPRITDLIPRDSGWGKLALLAAGAARAARPGLDGRSLVTGGSHPKCHRSHMSGQHVSRGTEVRAKFRAHVWSAPPSPSLLAERYHGNR